MSETEQEPKKEALGENTVLNHLLGDHPKTRMMVVFLSEKRTDINISELARLAGIDRSTVYSHLDDLLEIGVVEKTREVGGSKMYRINRDSPAAEKLAELEWALVEEASE